MNNDISKIKWMRIILFNTIKVMLELFLQICIQEEGLWKIETFNKKFY